MKIGVGKGYKGTPEERFFRKVRQAENGCWIWIGANDGHGYGNFWHEERNIKAHIFAFKVIGHGTIVDGLQLDHLCCTPSCVNPAHLEPVTAKENMRRRSVAQTYCVHGHEYTEENTIVRRDRPGQRLCKECRKAADRIRDKNRTRCRYKEVAA